MTERRPTGSGGEGEHFTAAEFTDLVMNKLPIRRRKQLVRHMLRGCPACAAISSTVFDTPTGRRAWQPRLPAGVTHAEFDRVFTSATSATELRVRQMAWERLVAWAQWCDIEGLPPDERERRVRLEISFHTFGMYERLIEASVWYRRNDPAEAVDIVTLAVLVAENMPASHIPGRAGGRTRLMARAWTHLANALRMASDFEGARGALNQAWEFWEESRDPETEAKIYSIESSYLTDLGNFRLADIIAGEALAIYQRLGSGFQNHQGSTLLRMGDNLAYIEPARAVLYLRQGLALIDAQQEPRLHLSGQHNLAWCLAAMGESAEAMVALEQVRPLYRKFDEDEYVQLRLHWLEGRVARSLGKVTEAAQMFGQLAEQFEALDLRHELLLVCLDWAEALTARGDFDAAVEVLNQVTPRMRGWSQSTYPLAAWLLLVQAVKARNVGDLFAQLQVYYRQSWKVPAEFHPGAAG